MAMKFYTKCPDCGKAHHISWDFCPHCGEIDWLESQIRILENELAGYRQRLEKAKETAVPPKEKT